jgi:hypothetical protein
MPCKRKNPAALVPAASPDTATLLADLRSLIDAGRAHLA